MTKQPEDWLDDVPVMTSKMKTMKLSGSVKVKLNVTPKN
jgi:hypothetical protein